MRRCVCGMDENECLREQARAQTREPCDDRVAAREAEEAAEEGHCEATTLCSMRPCACRCMRCVRMPMTDGRRP